MFRIIKYLNLIINKLSSHFNFTVALFLHILKNAISVGYFSKKLNSLVTSF